MSEPAHKALAVASLGGAVYLGYRYWYLPMVAKQRAAQAASEYQRRTGASWEDSMRAAGNVACMAYAAANGISPQASALFCPLAGGIATEALKQAPKIVLQAGKGALKIAASPFKAAKKEVSGFVKDTKKFLDSF